MTEKKSTNDIWPLIAAAGELIGGAVGGAGEIGGAIAGGAARAAGGAVANSIATQRKEDDDNSGTGDSRFSQALSLDAIKRGKSACVK
ncbi:MAG TPA: hypothetical protein VIE65_22440 [Methylobacter sp.]|jgi:hypothetical protein